MTVKGLISIHLPVLPKSLQNVIFQYGMIQPTETELRVIASAYDLLDRYSAAHPFPPKMWCNLIFSSTPEITLVPTADQFGYNTNLAVVDIANVHRQNCTQSGLLLSLLEELCHSLYLIRNEYLVKQTVIYIARQDYASLSLHEAYPSMFDEYDRPIFCEDYADDYFDLT